MHRRVFVASLAFLCSAGWVTGGGLTLEPPAATAVPGVTTIASGVLTGPRPADDAAFDRLKTMGVKSVLSVGAQGPDVERAKARGMTAAHEPIGFGAIRRGELYAIASGIRDLPGPVYVHGDADVARPTVAASSACVALGRLDVSKGEAVVKSAGVPARYAALIGSVKSAAEVTAAEMTKFKGDLPAEAADHAIKWRMVVLDDMFSSLGSFEKNKWSKPEGYDDVDPVTGARAMARWFRALAETPASNAKGEDFLQRLGAAATAADGLARAAAGVVPAVTSRAYAQLNQACSDCHDRYTQ